MLPNYTMLFIASAFLLNFEAWTLDITVAPARVAIHPEAPLSLNLKIHTDDADRTQIWGAYIHNDLISITVSDESGNTVCRSEPWSWRCPRYPRHVWETRFKESIEAEKQVVFSEWCSTALPPGQYKIACEIPRIGVYPTGVNVGERRDFSPPLRSEFLLTVLQRDDAAVRREYEHVFATALADAVTVEEWRAREHAVELIVYAGVPIALPFQLELLTGKVKMHDRLFNECHAVDLALYLVEQDRPEVASGLVDVLHDLEDETVEMEPATCDYLTKLVLWTIHEMHSHGNPEVVAIVEEIVAQYAKPDDPRPIPGLD